MGVTGMSFDVDLAKQDFDRGVDHYCRYLEIGRTEFLRRIRDACNRNRSFYIRLSSLREKRAIDDAMAASRMLESADVAE